MIGTIWIEKLACIEERDPGMAEPYLWAAFYRVDRDVLLRVAKKDPAVLDGLPGNLVGRAYDLLETVEPDPAEFLYAPPGEHGNLGGGMAAGKTRLVPSALGFWTTELVRGEAPARLPTAALRLGVVAVLLEQDNTPGRVAEKIHQEAFLAPVRARLREVIGGRARKLLGVLASGDDRTEAGVLSSPDPMLNEDLVRSLVDGIRDRLEAEVAVFGNRDDIIGGLFAEWGADELFAQPRHLNRIWKEPESEDGEYRLSVRAWVETQLGQPAAHAWADGELGVATVEGDGSQRLVVFRRRAERESWAHMDVSYDVEAPLPLEETAPVIWGRPSDGTEHVLYRSGERLVEAYRERHGRWRVGDGVQRLTRAQGVRGEACAWVREGRETQHIAFIDGAGRLRELRHHPRLGWHRGDALTRAVEAADLQLGDTRLAGLAWSDGQYVFARGEAGRIWLARSAAIEGEKAPTEREWLEPEWSIHALTDDEWRAAGDVAVAATDAELVVAFTDDEGGIRLLRSADGQEWAREEGTANAGGAAATGRPALARAQDGLRIVYRDAGGTLHALEPAGGGWTGMPLACEPEPLGPVVADPVALSGPPAAVAVASEVDGLLWYLCLDEERGEWVAAELKTGPTVLTKR